MFSDSVADTTFIELAEKLNVGEKAHLRR